MPISQLYAGNPAIYLDGVGADYDVPVQHGPTRYSRPQFPYTLAGNCLLAEQTFRQKVSLWQSSSPGTNLGFFSPGGQGPFYLTYETPHRDIGGGLVEWDRQSASIPAPFDLPIVVAKSFQYAWAYVPSPGGAIADATINSISRVVRGRQNYYFFRTKDDIPANFIPPIPVIAIFTLNSLRGWSDFGTGFPQALLNGTAVYTDNAHTETLVASSIEEYQGNMIVVKRSYASQ
jgi:hypothetical protein